MLAIKCEKENMEKIKVSIWNSDLALVNDFYNEVDYGGVASPRDVVVVAANGDRIVGVVRICKENGILVLRGMEIAKEYQRQGIGTSMLQKVEEVLDQQECYGIPYDHLEKFYARIGFHFIDEKEAPPHLRDRIRSYRSKSNGKKYAIMKREV